MSCTDQDEYKIKIGGLVLYKEQVHKVNKISKSNGSYYIVLCNINGKMTGVDPKDVQWLSEDTITDDRNKSRFNKGDFLTKRYGNYTCRVLGTYLSPNGQWHVEYESYYGGSRYTGTISESDCLTAKKPKYWDKQKLLHEKDKAFGSKGTSTLDYMSRSELARIGSKGVVPLSGYNDDFRPRKQCKRDNISTGELIEDEARSLRKNGGKASKEKPAPKIKTRKGDW